MILEELVNMLRDIEYYLDTQPVSGLETQENQKQYARYSFEEELNILEERYQSVREAATQMETISEDLEAEYRFIDNLDDELNYQDAVAYQIRVNEEQQRARQKPSEPITSVDWKKEGF